MVEKTACSVLAIRAQSTGPHLVGAGSKRERWNEGRPAHEIDRAHAVSDGRRAKNGKLRERRCSA